MDSIRDFVSKFLKEHLDDIMDEAFQFDSDDSLQQLNDTFNARIAVIDALADDKDAKLEQYKKAAIEYCDAAAIKSNKHKQAILDACNNQNWEVAFNSLDKSSKVNNLFDKIKAKLLAVGDLIKPENISVADKAALWGNVQDEYTVNLGTNKSIQLPTSATINGKTYTTDEIQYRAVGQGEIDANKLKFLTNAYGEYTVTVEMVINGVVVSSKPISLKVKNTLNLEKESNTTVNGETVKDIMLSDNNIYQSNWFSPGNAFSAGKSFITSTLDEFERSLISGLSGRHDEQKIKDTVDILKQYYIKLLENMKSAANGFREHDYKVADDKGWHNDVVTSHSMVYTSKGNKGIDQLNFKGFTYTDADGNEQTLQMDGIWKEYSNDRKVGLDDIPQNSTSGFGISHSRDGSHSYMFAINTKDLLILFKRIYETL